jgi:RNA polymerase sigma-70 factor (ECF subfamily)
MQRDKKLLERFRSQVKEEYEHVEEIVQLHQSSAILENAIKQLSPQQKKVYELVKVEGCTYKKAAEIMGISPFTVKEYLVTTKKFIRNYLRTHMDNAPELLFFVAICINIS